MPPPREHEFGTVECMEVQRVLRHGGMQPLLCRADDGALYAVKPFSSGGDWPQVLEWVCARLGRTLGLPIPNYRLVQIGAALAEEWNTVHARRIEAGPGFGSQFIDNALECDTALVGQIDPALGRRLLAFDWWVRNPDRAARNTNLLWNAALRCCHVIDHDQAGQMGSSDGFWSGHLFAHLAASEAEWPPPELRSDFRAALAIRTSVRAELPASWTSRGEGLDWFWKQLERCLDDAPHKEWRNYE